MKRTWMLGVVLSLSACGGGGSGQPTVTHTIPIGALAALTGNGATLDYQKAFQLAQDQMNQALTIAKSNIRFQVTVADSQGTATAATAAAMQLIGTSGVKAIVTDVSGDTVPVNMFNYDPASTLNKVPITCYACSSSFINNPNVTETDPIKQAAERDADGWLYRVFFNAKYETLVQTQIALAKGTNGDVNADGTFKVTVYAQNDAFGQSVSASITSAVGMLSTLPSSIETIYVPPTADVNSYNWAGDLAKVTDDFNENTQLTDGFPDAIIVAVLSAGATATVQNYHNGGYTIPLEASTAFRRDYILRSIGAAAEGVEGDSNYRFAQNDAGAAFNSNFQSAAGNIPEQLSSGAYDSAMVLMLASLIAAQPLQNADDVTPTQIRDAIPQIAAATGLRTIPTVDSLTAAVKQIAMGMPIHYDGASGACDFSATGDLFPPLVHWKVENAQFVELESYNCSDAQPLCPAAN
jgi:ABC-type branched-subunit amino acid transport system substrate-binding protein